jgi:formiminotetrahydrofolate cyclodeaminase
MNSSEEGKGDGSMAEKLIEYDVKKFADVMASDAPAPGGGSASALAGALGSALVSMVCALTQGREKYKEYEEETAAVMAAAQTLKDQLLEAVDSDTDAFNAVSAAFGMPKSTDEEKAARSKAIQEGMILCIESPLAMMHKSLDVLHLAQRVAAGFNTSSASDLGVGVLLVKAGLHGAWLNVKINLGSLKDKEKAVAYEEEAKGILQEASALADSLYEKIEEML